MVANNRVVIKVTPETRRALKFQALQQDMTLIQLLEQLAGVSK